MVHFHPLFTIVAKAESLANKWFPKQPSPPAKLAWGVLQLNLIALQNWEVWPLETVRNLSMPVGVAKNPFDSLARAAVKLTWSCLVLGLISKATAPASWDKSAPVLQITAPLLWQLKALIPVPPLFCGCTRKCSGPSSCSYANPALSKIFSMDFHWTIMPDLESNTFSISDLISCETMVPARYQHYFFHFDLKFWKPPCAHENVLHENMAVALCPWKCDYMFKPPGLTLSIHACMMNATTWVGCAWRHTCPSICLANIPALHDVCVFKVCHTHTAFAPHVKWIFLQQRLSAYGMLSNVFSFALYSHIPPQSACK